MKKKTFIRNDRTLTLIPGSPGSPGSPFNTLGGGGCLMVVHTNVHPSVQHFLVPSQSLSNKHPDVLSAGGHSALASGLTGGHCPGLMSAWEERE